MMWKVIRGREGDLDYLGGRWKEAVKKDRWKKGTDQPQKDLQQTRLLFIDMNQVVR